MAFKRPAPSDIGVGGFRHRHTTSGVHAFDTEARSLEEACEIIHRQQINARRSETLKNKKKKLSLGQELGLAKGQARARKDRGEISLAPVAGISHSRNTRKKSEKLPHPFFDLTPDEKRIKAQKMFATGLWGLGLYGCRALAKRFRVPLGTMVQWLENTVAPE